MVAQTEISGPDRPGKPWLGISPRQMEDEWRWIESLYVDDSDLEITFWLVFILGHHQSERSKDMKVGGPHKRSILIHPPLLLLIPKIKSFDRFLSVIMISTPAI